MSRYPFSAFEHYWTMWNTPDPGAVRRHLDLAVTEEFVFCDPVDFHVGRDELERNVRRLRSNFPDARFELRSGFQHHHNRYRYRWDMVNEGDVVVQGMDVTTVGETGLIERIDGFFGDLPPMASTDE